MYLTEVFFYNTRPENSRQQIPSINRIIDQWRYNGQIIGREIPLFFAEQEQQQGFALRVICPEQHSLLAQNNNLEVQRALVDGQKCGVILDSFHIIADDLNSDVTSRSVKPAWQVLYTTYLQCCSPIRSGEDFSPIPLYKQLKDIPHLAQDLIKWQENWQACDQLQMNGSTLENAALYEILDIRANLFKHGYYLAKEIEKHSAVPTYYYLYRVGGASLEQERQRRCPICGEKWSLNRPHFDVIHFQCQRCRLMSNLSWNWQ